MGVKLKILLAAGGVATCLVFGWRVWSRHSVGTKGHSQTDGAKAISRANILGELLLQTERKRHQGVSPNALPLGQLTSPEMCWNRGLECEYDARSDGYEQARLAFERAAGM